jgi:hypothetical protein
VQQEEHLCQEEKLKQEQKGARGEEERRHKKDETSLLDKLSACKRQRADKEVTLDSTRGSLLSASTCRLPVLWSPDGSSGVLTNSQFLACQ